MELIQDEIDSIREKMSSLRMRLSKLEALEDKLKQVVPMIDCSNDNNNNDDDDNGTPSTTTMTLIQQVVRMLEYKYFSLRQAFDQFPQLKLNRHFWMQFLSSKRNRDALYCIDFPDVLFGDNDSSIDHTIPSTTNNDIILADKEIMILACSFHMRIYERIVEHPMIRSTLGHDEDIITAALQCSPFNIFYMDPTVQKQYPHLIAATLRKLPLHVDELQTQLRYHLDYSLWKNRNVALAWVERGGILFENHWYDPFRDDPEIVYRHVQNCSSHGRFLKKNNNTESISISFPSSQRLRQDKEFMLRIIEVNGRLLSYCSKELLLDNDIILAALSDTDAIVYFGNYYAKLLLPITTTTARQEQHNVNHRTNHDPAGSHHSNNTMIYNYEYLANNFAQFVKRKLRCYDNFITILCAISHHTKNDNNNYQNSHKSNSNARQTQSSYCNLQLLDQGKETKVDAYGKVIGQYIGIPTGKQLHLLRKAHDNLSLWGLQ